MQGACPVENCAGGRRESRPEVSVSDFRNFLGGWTRRSASLAISAARLRALSERSPSARTCSRQATFLNRNARLEERLSSPNNSRYRERKALAGSFRSSLTCFSIDDVIFSHGNLSACPWTL